MQDQHRLPDLAQPIANVEVPGRLVLPDDGMQRHLAEVTGILGDPLGVLEKEMWLVEIRVAPKWAFREPRDLCGRGTAPLATAVGCPQDEATDRVRPIKRQLV